MVKYWDTSSFLLKERFYSVCADGQRANRKPIKERIGVFATIRYEVSLKSKRSSDIRVEVHVVTGSSTQVD